MEAIYHAEGRCTPNGATAFHYEYTIKDHLGNARVNFRANGTAVIFLEEMHYYPFGMQMDGMGTQNPANKYLYNGKERNEDLGLNLSDYGARWYDAALGRWWSVDPKSSKFARINPYSFSGDNPIRFVDPTGEEIIVYYKEAKKDKNGEIKKDKNGNIQYKTKSITYEPGKEYDGDNVFVKEVFKSLDYIQTNGADQGIVKEISESKDLKLGIKENTSESSRGSAYTDKDKTIVFDSKYGKDLKDPNDPSKSTGKQSPALELLHEVAHAYRFNFERNDLRYDPNDKAKSQYEKFEEEQYVVDRFETPGAIRLPGEGIRKNYLSPSEYYPVEGPTSTKKKQ